MRVDRSFRPFGSEFAVRKAHGDLVVARDFQTVDRKEVFAAFHGADHFAFDHDFVFHRAENGFPGKYAVFIGQFAVQRAVTEHGRVFRAVFARKDGQGHDVVFRVGKFRLAGKIDRGFVRAQFDFPSRNGQNVSGSAFHLVKGKGGAHKS